MLSNHASRASTPAFYEVVPGLYALRDVFVNLYYVAADPSQPSGAWVLIDAGLPGSAGKIKKHAEQVFGAHNPPVAILLTHGHFDHAGSLEGLLAAWPGVPLYAHPLELPYLTGRSSYPPPDPTVGGGLLAWSSFLYPRQPYNFGPRAQALPADGSVPGLPGWRWLPTPGHTAGHVSFFHNAEKVLVAGDAFTTVVAESGLATLMQKQIVHGPPAYFTPDWDAARTSVRHLADLSPEVAATGHGIAMHGEALRRQLRTLGEYFDQLARPRAGRYAHAPALADASGVRTVPPPVVSTLVKGLVAVGTLLTVLGLVLAKKQQKTAKTYRASYRNHPARPRRVGSIGNPPPPAQPVGTHLPPA